MNEVSTIGLDLAKHVFQAHGADAGGVVVFRKQLRRDNVLAFFAQQPACLVAMEACASAHHWAREIGKLGHKGRNTGQFNKPAWLAFDSKNTLYTGEIHYNDRVQKFVEEK